MGTLMLKKTIKKIIGTKNIKRVKSLKGIIKYIDTSIMKSNSKFEIKSSEWCKYAVYSKPNKHVFFGYYDIHQFDKAEEKILVIEISKKASPGKETASLEWIDIKTGEYHEIADTKVWCWQQGARLRWHPINENRVLYNDVENDTYVTREYDIICNKLIKTYSRACYDVTSDAKLGLSLNYSRLQRLRPGYGYNVLPDMTSDDLAPELDGIYLINLETNEVKLIISLKQLSELAPGSEKEWNYINHISISPNGKKFMFFHLWAPEPEAHWHNKMFVANLDGSELKCVEDEFIISHYCWRNDDSILATTVNFEKNESQYILYKLKENEKIVLTSSHLKKDGHPSFMNDSAHFISDTYPLSGCMQHLFSERIGKSQFEEICSVYSDPRLFGEKRCDLHPRLSSSNKYISVDSTFKDGKRSVIVFRRKSV